MTLNDFANMCFSLKDDAVEIMVYRGEYLRDSHDTLMFTLKSDWISREYLKTEYANAEVTRIYARKKDKFIVTIGI